MRAFEDELWGALKPMFRPRTFGDPNMKYAAEVRNGTGPFARSSNVISRSDDPRATRAGVVRMCPEAVVKVTRRKKGAGHLDYIGRHRKLEIETRDGERIADKADIARIPDEWSDPLYWHRGTRCLQWRWSFRCPKGGRNRSAGRARNG